MALTTKEANKLMDDQASRIVYLEEELGRAWRALHVYANTAKTGVLPTDATRAYHQPTIAAAKRFVLDGAFDGTAYFIGKPVEVLHETLSR